MGSCVRLSALTQDDTRVAAANAYKKDNQTIYEKGVVTSCKPCEQHPESPPIWRVKATRIVQDKIDHNFYYENAMFEVYRHSGGMGSLFLYAGQHGAAALRLHAAAIRLPFLDNGLLAYNTVLLRGIAELRPDAEAGITTQAGYLIETDWRQKLWNGAYEVKLYGSYTDQTADDFWGDRNWRGSAESRAISSSVRLGHIGWNAIIESDDTFRRFYNIDSIYAYQRVSTLYLPARRPELFQHVRKPLWQSARQLTYDWETNTYHEEGDHNGLSRASIITTSITKPSLAASSAST